VLVLKHRGDHEYPIDDWKGRKGHRREVCFGQSSTGSDVGGLILPLSYCLSLNSKGRCATDTLMIDFEHGEIVNNFLDALYLDRVVRDCFLWYLNDLLIYVFRALHASWHALWCTGPAKLSRSCGLSVNARNRDRGDISEYEH